MGTWVDLELQVRQGQTDTIGSSQTDRVVIESRSRNVSVIDQEGPGFCRGFR